MCALVAYKHFFKFICIAKGIKFANQNEEQMFKKCQIEYSSVDNIEGICNSCRNAISKLKPPKSSI